MAFWVYILRCADGSYYTGYTDKIGKRIQEHHAGAITGCYTFKRRPLELVFSQNFPTREEALASEQQIKGWSRIKKEAMIRGDWAEVSRLAKPVRSEPMPPVRTQPMPPVHPKSTTTVRLEQTNTVRPELVEGQDTPVHGSTGSPRTEQGP